jgi:hypothetical protein
MKDGMKQRKTILAVSILLAAAFLLAQFLFQRTASAGGWCSPYLGAPASEGHPAFQTVSTGFPLPVVSVTVDMCSEAGGTTTEWNPVGLGVDGLLLGLITFPLWQGWLRKKASNH